MKSGLALLGAASLALAGAMTAQAEIAPPSVSEAAILDEGMPHTLDAFGFFIDGAAQIPTPGVVPYRLNTPLYTDGATKLRFVYVPYGERIDIGTVEDTGGLLQFPVGSALIKTFAYGVGKDRRLIETRVLLHRADGWVALPYKWNAEQTEARLALAGGRLPVTTPDGQEISYRIPNKNQCKECHSLNDAVTPIGPKLRNLSAQWLQEMKLPLEGADVIPLWEDRAEADLTSAARGYLDVNCAHCHQPGAKASNSGLDLRWEQADLTSIGVFKRPVAAGRGSGGLEFDIDPGHPERSIFTFRMGSEDPGIAMPETGKTTVDAEGLDLIERWIAAMEAP